MRRLLLSVLVATAALPVAAADAYVTGFHTPSRNIGCAYLSFDGERSLRCDIRATDNDPPPKPSSCELDWGYSFGLRARGRGKRLCVSDAPIREDFPVLGYGRTFERGPFTCRSRRTGLRCTNRRGHGFELSRERQRLF